MCHTSSGLFVKCLRENQSQPGVTSVSILTIPRTCLLYSSSKERSLLHILYLLLSCVLSVFLCLLPLQLLPLDEDRVWEFGQHAQQVGCVAVQVGCVVVQVGCVAVQVGCVALFSNICFLEEEGSMFLADLEARSTFTWIEQQNQDKRQQQYIRQHFYPLPIYHFFTSLLPPVFFFSRQVHCSLCTNTTGSETEWHVHS